MSEEFRFAEESDRYAGLGGSGSVDVTGFRFAPSTDYFSTRLPSPPTAERPTTEAFRFAPGSSSKGSTMAAADDAGLGSFQKDHHDDDCGCHGACASCSAEYMKFVKSARPATKLEVGSRVRCKSCPGQPGKKVMVVRELTATEKGYLLSVDYEDGSGSMHGIFDHDELVAA
jgi:hypothetical protein